MKNILVFAHRKEADIFLENIDFKRIDFVFENFYESSDYFLLITGEGLQNTTEKLSSILSSFGKNIDLIINLGVAGALNSKLKKMDIIEVRTSYAQPFEEIEFKSFTSQSDSKFDCISTNKRILAQISKEKLAYFADIVDRELWAIGSVSQLFKKKFISIKIISDEINEEEFCESIIAESKIFSEKLYQYFSQIDPRTSKNHTKTESEIFKNKSFHFSVTQKRQYENFMSLLAIKFNEATLLSSDFFQDLTKKEIAPKQRTKDLISHLTVILNPHHKQYYEKLDQLISKVSKNGIQINYDQNLEDSNIDVSFKTNSSLDLSHKLSVISTLPINEIQKIFNGELDV